MRAETAEPQEPPARRTRAQAASPQTSGATVRRQARVAVTRRYVTELAAIGMLVGVTIGLTRGLPAGALGGALAVVALLVTVLVHEGGHAAAATLSGVAVHALTLRGALTASVRRDRVRPGRTAARTEVLICLAGPVASLGLLGVAIAVLPLVHGPGATAAWCLLAANVIAVAGSLPGVPSTDGTRALSAWRGRTGP